jgi:hypothetical protein
VIVTRSGQLDHLSTEHPTPAARLIETLQSVEVFDVAGTSGEGGEEASLRVGKGDAGHDPETIAATGQQLATIGGTNSEGESGTDRTHCDLWPWPTPDEFVESWCYWERRKGNRYA